MRRPLAALTATVLLSSILTTTGASAAPGLLGGEEPGPVRIPADTVAVEPLLTLGKGKGRETYIVQMSSAAVAGRSAEKVRGRKAPSASLQRSRVRSEQATTRTRMNRSLGRTPKIRDTFTEALNGFTVSLTAAEAKKVAALDGVTAVTVETYEKLDTDRGPTAIGAPGTWDGSALPASLDRPEGTLGEGVVIGIIDTGIDSSHPSFAAQLPASEGGDGYQHVNPLGSGTYLGMCDPDSEQYRAEAVCNDKVIGQWKYTAATDPEVGDDPGVGDSNGHGTHVASTAAGNTIREANATHTLGGGPLTLSGVAPHATLISYDACATYCPSSALLAALEQALADSVDVVNYSISSGEGWSTPISVAFRNLRAAGVHVARSAGNSGPASGSAVLGTSVPWVTSVASTDLDRTFKADIAILSPNAATMRVSGTAGTQFLPSVEAPLVKALASDPLCRQTFEVEDGASEETRAAVAQAEATARAAYEGKIVVCQRGTNDRVEKSANVKKVGAVGMVLYNTSAGETLNMDEHTLPSVHLTAAQGQTLVNALAATAGTPVVARISPTYGSDGTTGHRTMSSFSSRGPVAGHLTGPSLAAPGGNIYAANALSGSKYVPMSGTSMASPHVAGTYALLKSLHPDWTPAQMQSAAMTTAHADVTETSSTSTANQFAAGSGLVDVTRAASAGLILDENAADYTAAAPESGGDPRTLNSASLVDGDCFQTCGWSRTLTGTDLGTGTWQVNVTAPTGVTVSAPSTLDVVSGENVELDVTVDLDASVREDSWQHGGVVLTPPAGSDAQPARFPLSVRVKTFSLATEALTESTRRSAGSQDFRAATRPGTTVVTRALARGATLAGTVAQRPDPAWISTTSMSIHPVLISSNTIRVVAELTSDAADLDLYTGNGSPLGTTNSCRAETAGSTEKCSLLAPTAGTWQLGVHGVNISPFQDRAPYTLRVTQVTATGPNLTTTFTAGAATTQTLTWNEPRMQAGETWYGALVATGPHNVRKIIPIDVHREADDVTHAISPAQVTAGDELTHTVSLTPEAGDVAQTYAFSSALPSGATYLGGLDSAGATVSGGTLTWEHQVAAGSTAPVTFTYRTSTPLTLPEDATLTHELTHSTTLPGTQPAVASASSVVGWPAAPSATALTDSGPGIRRVTVPITARQELKILDADGDPATTVTVADGTYTVDDDEITFTPDTGFHGTADPVTYRISDPHGQTSDATFTPTVLPAEPTAGALTARGPGALSASVSISGWQTLGLVNADGDPATRVNVTGGTYTVTGNVITFTPDAGFHGEATPVTYRITDVYDQSDDATFTPTVFAPAPTATAKTARGHGDQSVTIGLEAWQTLRLLDAHGDPATTVNVTGGTYTVTGGTITFTPNTGFHGEADPVTYRVSDTYAQKADATFTPTVLADAPVGSALTARGHGPQTVTLALASWQTLGLVDADGDPATSVTVTGGTYAVSGGAITFTPNAGFHGTPAPVTYRVADIYLQRFDATFTPTVVPAVPVAQNLTSRGHGTRNATVSISGWQTLGLLDADGDPATSVKVTGGTYTVDGATITFTPDAGFHGEVTPVTYRVSDAYTQKADATFTPTVFAPAPAATAKTARGHGNQSVTIDLETWQTLRLLDTDGDPAASVTVTGGTYTRDGARITFTPNTGFHGAADPVTYRIADLYGQSDTATFTPTVLPAEPEATPLTSRGHGNRTVTVPLTAWQTLRLLDADGKPATTVTGTGGIYSVDGDEITFTPDAGFHGAPRRVFYRISDTYDQSDDATFTPTVFAPAPTATAETSRGHGNQSVTIGLELWQTLRLLDAHGDPAATLTVDDGTYTVTGNVITFTPDADFHGEADPVTYRIADGYGQSDDATFTPTVLPAEPEATAKTSRGHGNRSVTIDLQAWQTLRLLDADGDPATRVNVTGGTYSVDGDEITFTPDAGFRGTPDAVTFRISDTYGQSDDATFTPTVVPAAPQASDLTSRGHGEQQVTVTHQAWQNLEILDADGQPASTVRVGAGTYTVDGDVITFTPKAGYHGRATSLTFRVTDGFSQEIRASYTPTVLATAPSVTDLTSRLEGQQGVTVALELWQQLTLLDGTNPVTALRVPQGTYSVDGTAITFTPEMGVHGAADPVTFRVSDVYGQSDEGTYTPTVLPIAPAAGTLTSSGTGVQSVIPDVMAWQRLTLTDAQGDPVTTLTNASGTYVLDAQGTITFTPATGFVGAAAPVTFEIADGYGRSARGTWTPTVVAVPGPPVVVPPAGLAGTLKVTEKSGVVRSSVLRAKAPAKLTARCVPSAGTASRCSVTLTATVKGKRVKVGSGKADGGKVVVKLTARGRALVARPGGVKVKAVMAVRTQDGQRATDTKKFTLVSQRFTVSRTVKFSAASSTVSKQDAAWLRSVRSRTAGVRTVICTGYTDSTGNRTSNKALARARAAAVCGKLALPRRITVVVKSGGQGSPVASNATARGRAENRRVEITFVQ